jgi:hypothetical protein
LSVEPRIQGLSSKMYVPSPTGVRSEWESVGDLDCRGVKNRCQVAIGDTWGILHLQISNYNMSKVKYLVRSSIWYNTALALSGQ